MNEEKVIKEFALINRFNNYNSDGGYCYIWRHPSFPDYDLIFRSSFGQNSYYLFFKNTQLVKFPYSEINLKKIIEVMLDHFWSQNNVT